jgi:hypothetical protein
MGLKIIDEGNNEDKMLIFQYSFGIPLQIHDSLDFNFLNFIPMEVKIGMEYPCGVIIYLFQ